MIHFQWPWIFAALPLPWLVWRFAPMAEAGRGAVLRVPVLNDFQVASGAGRGQVRAGRWLLLPAVLAWLLLLGAGARPQWLGDPLELPVSGRDLMLAVDLSGSMEVEDFQLGGRTVNRLTAIKAVAGQFIDRRVGDRIGLILFGRQAYLQTPLTFDRTTVHTLLNEAAIGLAGKETAIGDAIGLAVKRLSKEAAATGKAIKSRVLILLTDGANTAGDVTPLKAAEIAAQKGLKIYTIGIGADEMLVRSLFGTQRVNPSQDLDEKSLKAIAQTTGGRYFRARDTEQLENIYKELDKLEPVKRETRQFRPVRALFMWPLGAALLLAALTALARQRWGATA
jgi:Ca-activated chloride channel family protein